MYGNYAILVLADFFATLLSDYLTFGPNHKEELEIGPWTNFIVITKSIGAGSGMNNFTSYLSEWTK